MTWFANPEDIQPNSPTLACGTLNDLKNMSHSAFTFDCAGSFQAVVDLGISVLNSYRSEVGSTQNQLESSVRNNMTNYVNIKNAESIIRDVDYAQESTNFNKLNIIAQAGSYVQSQANEIEKNYISQLLK
ncbi:flagellin [Aliarcobacter lanthieri]